MRLRVAISGEELGRRLCASMGSEEAYRAEKWLSTARVILALYCYTWSHVGTGQIAQSWLLQVLLNSYLLSSFLVFVLLRLHRAADSSYRLTTLAADLFFAAALTLFTGGSESGYGVLWVFVVVSAAARWGLRETNLSAAACGLLLLSEVFALRLWPRDFKGASPETFTMNQLLLRGAFLIIISLLLGHLVLRERRLRAEHFLLARVQRTALAETELNLALDALFTEIAPLYRPSKVLLALRKGSSEEVFFRELEEPSGNIPSGAVNTVLQFSRLEAATFSCSAHTWYFERNSRRRGRSYDVLAFDDSGRRVDFPDSEHLSSCFSASEVGSLMVSSFSFGEALSGRLILLSPSLRADCHAALRFLQALVKQVGPVVQNIYLLRDTHMHTEALVRAQLARELHDGTLQSLLSAEMQIEVLRKKSFQASSERDSRLAVLQSLIRQEALNLRDLIENTKPLNFGPRQLPDFLAEVVTRFRRETGISVRLETHDDNMVFGQTTCHEILRIVQEGLSNVRKHSGARNVVIRLSRDGEGQGKLLIEDDGLGFGFRGRVSQTQLEASHRGPGVIKERVRLIGGELTIDSTPGQGARLEITIPEHSHG